MLNILKKKKKKDQKFQGTSFSNTSKNKNLSKLFKI